MSFLIRNIKMSDLDPIFDLASQFNLLNLQADRAELTKKIERSELSFQSSLPKENSEYLFIMEETETNRIVGASQIIAKHGTAESPHYFFKVFKQDRFSKELGVGFIHQVLKLGENCSGPTEIGGLIVDHDYRGRPEKLGQQMSLIRFMFIGMDLSRFEDHVLCELSPSQNSDGRNEFWEALGRRFTGMTYREADEVSQKHKEFITTLFPHEEIYLCLLETKARLMVGRVGEDTAPAQHFLRKIGFQYLHEIDPFDGGPHWGAQTRDIKVIRELKNYECSGTISNEFPFYGIIAHFNQIEGEFRGVLARYHLDDQQRISVNAAAMTLLNAKPGSRLYVYSDI